MDTLCVPIHKTAQSKTPGRAAKLPTIVSLDSASASLEKLIWGTGDKFPSVHLGLVACSLMH